MVERVGSTSPLKVLGRYALHEVIAAGGMATVHYGRLLGPVGFARTVAIKRLHERLAQDPEFTSMFLDEARLAARIRHPNVVPTLDVVALEGEIFLVMEYVQGESLSRLYSRERERKTRVSIPILTTIMAAALHGLHAAHEATNENGEPLGIVHRDVSPQNILVGVDGVARVLDFGVAKAAGRAATTRDGQLKGKLSYMAPEQLRGKDVTRLVDVYAAGVVLWEGLVGRKLFKADSEAELVTKLLESKVEPPSKHVPEIPPELDAIVLKALSSEPSARFASAREMARALEKIAALVPASEIGEWVEQIAGNALSARSQTISRIERSSTSDVSAIPEAAARPSEPVLPVLPPSDGPSTDASHTNRSAYELPVIGPSSKRIKAVAIIAAFAALSIIGVLLIVASLGGRAPKTTGRAGPSASAVTEAPSPSQATPPPPSATPEPPVVAATPASVSAAVAPITKTTATVRPTGPRPTAAGVSCDPPYVVDANGGRRYKRECLR